MGVSPVGQSIAEAAAAIVSSLECWFIKAMCHQAMPILISFGIKLVVVIASKKTLFLVTFKELVASFNNKARAGMSFVLKSGVRAVLHQFLMK